MTSSGSKPSSRRTLAGLGLAAALGGLLVFGVLYEKPGKAAWNKILVQAGLREDQGSRFPFGWTEVARPAEWPGVQSEQSPQWKVRRGVDVVRVATGFTYPVNLAFKAEPPTLPTPRAST